MYPGRFRNKRRGNRPETARRGVCVVAVGVKVDQPLDNMEALDSGSTIITWE